MDGTLYVCITQLVEVYSQQMKCALNTTLQQFLHI